MRSVLLGLSTAILLSACTSAAPSPSPDPIPTTTECNCKEQPKPSYLDIEHIKLDIHFYCKALNRELFSLHEDSNRATVLNREVEVQAFGSIDQWNRIRESHGLPRVDPDEHCGRPAK